MSYKIFFFISLLFYSFQIVFASESLEVTAENIFDYRSDQLRTHINNNNTSIRNLSIAAKKKLNKNTLFFIELLGDENLTTNGLEFNLGEIYYETAHRFYFLNSIIKLGSFKLDYGLLNPNDASLYILPSYYKFMYGLPRGIDTGLYFNNKILKSNFSLGFGLYMGKSFRSKNIQQQKTYGLPLSLSLNYNFNEKSKISIDYYVREYEKNPKIRGLGLSYKGHFDFNAFNISILSELISINSNLISYNSEALAYMISPTLEYKNLYTTFIYTSEEWKSKKASSVEDYISLRLGYIFSKNIKLELEKLNIRNKEGQALKENSFLARLYMNWSF